MLYSIGTKREVERYLRIFSSSSNPTHPAKFAVVKVGGAVLDDLDELALSLSFLYRVGLYPVIVHGAGPQLNDIMDKEGVVPDYIDGIRVTSEYSQDLPTPWLLRLALLFRTIFVCSLACFTPSAIIAYYVCHPSCAPFMCRTDHSHLLS